MTTQVRTPSEIRLVLAQTHFDTVRLRFQRRAATPQELLDATNWLARAREAVRREQEEARQVVAIAEGICRDAARPMLPRPTARPRPPARPPRRTARVAHRRMVGAVVAAVVTFGLLGWAAPAVADVVSDALWAWTAP